MVVLDGGKDADFVEGVLDLFFGEVGQFDFFEGVDLMVFEALDLVDDGVGALAWVRWEVPSLDVMENSFSDINYKICEWGDNFNELWGVVYNERVWMLMKWYKFGMNWDNDKRNQKTIDC